MEIISRVNFDVEFYVLASFDILRDSLGLVRSEFPHTAYLIAGTQVNFSGGTKTEFMNPFITKYEVFIAEIVSSLRARVAYYTNYQVCLIIDGMWRGWALLVHDMVCEFCRQRKIHGIPSGYLK